MCLNQQSKNSIIKTLQNRHINEKHKEYFKKISKLISLTSNLAEKEKVAYNQSKKIDSKQRVTHKIV
jgi:hypothetical protein